MLRWDSGVHIDCKIIMNLGAQILHSVGLNNNLKQFLARNEKFISLSMDLLPFKLAPCMLCYLDIQ